MPTSFSRRQSFRFVLALALAFTLAAGTWPKSQRAASPQVPSKADAPAEVPSKTKAETEQRAKEAYGKLGVSFEENRGQVDKHVRFLARHGGATVFLSNDEASFVLRGAEAPAGASGERPTREEVEPEALARSGRSPAPREGPKSHAVHMKFEGANPRAEVSGEREMEGKVNYFRGSDPSKWQAGVRTYGAVRYRGIYEGVDLIYYGNDRGEMEYDFEVAPGADPGRISFLIKGADGLEVDAAGGLVIKTPAGEMRQRKPTVYQEVGGARRSVEGGYVVSAGGRVRFALGEYDRSAPLIIDPALEYSTFLGGNYGDSGSAIAVDSSGNAYVTGYTYSTDFPVVNALQSSRIGNYDAFVTKLNAAGSALVYSTYLGGTNEDQGFGIAADSAGNAYVTGYTRSTNFPVVNALQGAHGAGNVYDSSYADAFATKLNAAGSALVYSTYLGGSGYDYGSGVAADSAGNAYVIGYTHSVDFPTANAFKVRYYNAVLPDAFVTKLNADGSAFVYSTYLGGSSSDWGSGIAVDSSGNAYVAGYTYSTDFPVVNALQGAHGGGYIDAFVTKLNAAGSALVYSTYLGGSNSDYGNGVAVDPSGNAYVTGYTSSTDFPTVNAIQGMSGGGNYDAFVTKLNAAGSALVYSTYLGGSGYDYGYGVAADSAGSAYVTGMTDSVDFPTADAIQSDKPYADSFVTKLNADGSAFIYSTYLGGAGYDYGYGVAADSAGNAYVTGYTSSRDFPATPMSFQPTMYDQYPYEYQRDAFVSKITTIPFIRGRVIAKGGAGEVGLPSVTIKLTGTETRTRQTDARGYYSFTGLTPGGDYTVTPSRGDWLFVPARRSFPNLNAFPSNANFATPALSADSFNVKEGDTSEVTATFKVRLQPASTWPVTVNYRIAGGGRNSASANTDYTPLPPGQLTFDPGQTLKTVAVQIKGDALDEFDETFNIILSEQANAVLPSNKGVCTIVDNDPRPSLTINDVAVTERNTDVTAKFTAKLSAPSGRTVYARYYTEGGTATAHTDYTWVDWWDWKTLIFAPGETTKTFAVTVKGDTLAENTETFEIPLVWWEEYDSPFNTFLADTGTCTIVDDDPAPSITISDVTVTEPDAGGVNAVFTVTLSAVSGQSVTVQYATGAGTAKASLDYVGLDLTTLTFAPSETSKTVTVRVKGDTAVEPEETFFVNLSGAVNASIADAQGLGTVTNDD